MLKENVGKINEKVFLIIHSKNPNPDAVKSFLNIIWGKRMIYFRTISIHVKTTIS